MKLYLPALSLLLLSACATVPADSDQASATVNYRALGTEPFWSLVITDGEMLLETPDSRPLRSRPFTARPSFNGWRYVSDRMTVDVTFTPCSDGMSDRTYKDSVTVEVGDRVYRGCGGGISAPKNLAGTSWTIESINGQAVHPQQKAQVTFGDGRLSATLGCNRLMAEYSFTKGKLSSGPVASPRMACPEQIAQQETAF